MRSTPNLKQILYCRSTLTPGWPPGVRGAEVRGGGVPAGGALPGLLPEPFPRPDVRAAAAGGCLHVTGLQNERNCPPERQQAFHLH